MLRKSMKKVLSFALVLFMVIGLINPTQGAKAAEESLLWEAVDESIDFDAITSSQEAEEAAPAYADDEVVRVIIEFEDASVIDAGFDVTEFSTDRAALKYSANLEKSQDAIIESIEDEVLDGEKLDVNYSFTLLTNAVSTDVEYGQIADIEAMDGVAAVRIETVYEPQVDEAAEPNTAIAGTMVGSYDTWATGYTGAGMRIAIIDTGINYDHPQFDPDAFMYALEEQAELAGRTVESYDLLDAAEIASVASLLNASDSVRANDYSKFYGNYKVPFTYSYVDGDFDITHDNDNQGPHGSHVSGIAAANRYLPSNGGYIDAKEAVGVVGIAPEAQILTMKVFGNNGGAFDSDYMAAIEDAVILGADAINLSLGSGNTGETKSQTAEYCELFDKLKQTNTIVSISAGNNGAFADESTYGFNRTDDVSVATGGSPGSFTNAFTVASAINAGSLGNGIVVDGQTYGYYDTSDSGYGNRPFTSLAVNGNATEYDYVFIDGFGSADDFAGLNLAGKIVFCSRGSLSFYQKHDNAQAAGAIGCIVYNNADGVIRMDLSSSSATIPCVSMLQADGAAIKAVSEYDETIGAYTGKLTVNTESIVLADPQGYMMSDYSGWGVPGDLTLKPEITAPGQSIISTVDESESDTLYANYSGTSMAAPSIAGLSTLVLQYLQENNIKVDGLTDRGLAQSLIMSTATPLEEYEGTLYSPRKQGAGLANAFYATNSDSYILVGDAEGNDGKVKAELGDDPARTGKYSFDFTVYNLDPEKETIYVLDGVAQTDTPYEGFIMNSASNIDVAPKFSGENVGYVYDLDGDGDVDADDVQYLLSYVNGSVEENEVLDQFAEYFDFNGNETLDTDDARIFYIALTSDTWNLGVQYVKVNGQATINASLELTDDWKETLDEFFANGIYVEGFVFLYGETVLSIPVLAFYGNWTDSSMFEPFIYAESVIENGKYWDTYTGISATNYLTYTSAGESDAYMYQSNAYEHDDAYMAERNAFSSESGDTINKVVYSLIRNSVDTKLVISNAETGEIYKSSDLGLKIAEYWSESRGAWQNTSFNTTINWKGTDAKGRALADGTKVEIKVVALPAYYEDETKVPGKGTELVFPFTIDNTAPAAVINEDTIADGKAVITVSDNQYVAAVKLLNNAKDSVLASYAINQTEAGVSTDVTIDWPESVFYVAVIDYAGNMMMYRVNNTDVPDTTVASSIELDRDDATIVVDGKTTLSATVGPDNLKDPSVTWSSSDESVATVDAKGVVTGVAEGLAIITASTVSLGVTGEPLSADCVVEVIAISTDLKATLWDENGYVWFVDFDTAELPTYNKLIESTEVPFWSATDSYRESSVYGKMLYASAYDLTGNDEAIIYGVFPEADSDELLYINLMDENADIAYTFGGMDLANGAGNDMIMTPFYYFIVTNPIGDDGLVKYNGAWSLQEDVGDDSIVGIAYAGYQYSSRYRVYVDIYFFITDSGEVYSWFVFGDLGFNCYDLGSTDIVADYNYPSSLYYSFEDGSLYYSCYQGDTTELYNIWLDNTADNVTAVYDLGSFGDAVWPVSGLFEMDLDAAAMEASGAALVADIDALTIENNEAQFVTDRALISK